VENNKAFKLQNNSGTIIKPLTPHGAKLKDYGYICPRILTPKKAKELKALLRPLGQPTLTERFLFQKIKKAFNEKDFQLTIQRRKIEQLEATVKRLIPSKRKKVVLDPNSVFVDIEKIHKAQKEVGRISSESSNSSETEDSESKGSEASSCIVVEI